MDAVKVGDSIFVELTPSEDVHVYLLNEDERGNSRVVFPTGSSRSETTLAAEKVHRLPAVQILVPGGVQHFALIASREPLEELEKALDSFESWADPDPIQKTSSSREDRLTETESSGTPRRLQRITAGYPEGDGTSTDGVLLLRFRLRSPQ
jgi:hypothetical protein